MKELRVVRRGAQVEDSSRAGYSWTLPRLVPLAEQPFGEPVLRPGTRFGSIDASAILEPTRWERLALDWLGRQTGVAVQPPPTSEPLHPISSALAATQAWTPDALPDGVTVRRAATRRGEARATVRDIRTWLREKGLSGEQAAAACDDVTILVPGGAPVFALWHREFEFGGVPLQSQRLEPIGLRSFARWVVSLAQLSAWREHPVPRDVLRGILEAPHWSATAVSDEPGLRSAARKLLTSMRRDSFRFDEWTAHVQASENHEAVLQFSNKLMTALQDGPAFFGRLRRLLVELDVRVRARASGDATAATTVERVLAVLQRLEYEELAGQITGHRILVLEEAFRSTWLSLSKMRRHGVRLVSYDTYDGRETKLLFATGLGEGDFPKVPRRFNRDEERWARTIGLLRDGESTQDYVDEELERQLRLASHAFDRCSGDVVLSFASEGPGTEQRYPGPLLSLLLGGWPESAWYAGHDRVETFGWADEIPRSPDEADNWNDVALFAEDARFRRWLRTVDDEEPLSAVDSARIADICELSDRLATSREAFRERHPRPDETTNFGAHSGLLPGNVRPPPAFSASALENYGQCGTRYFFGKVLKVSDKHDLSEGLEATETGTIIHTAFATAAHEVVDIASKQLMSMCVEAGESADDAIARIRAQLDPHIDRTVRAFTAEQVSMSEPLIAAVVRRWGGAIDQWLRHHVGERFPGSPSDDELGAHPDVAAARDALDAQRLAIAAVRNLQAAIDSSDVTSQNAAGDFCPDGMRKPINKTALKAAYKDGTVEALLDELSQQLPAVERALQATEDAARAQWASHFNRDVAHGELAFGMVADDADPFSTSDGVTVYVEDVAIPVRGQVDRIDWDMDRHQLAIRDYKTGRRRTAGTLAAEIAAGQHLQLPLYALAIEELARRGALSHLEGAPTVEVSLEFPRDPSSRSDASLRMDQVSDYELHGRPADYTAISRAWLRSHVQNIAAGQFPLLPSKCPIENTGYCDFARACGYTSELGTRATEPRPRRPEVTAIEVEAAPSEKVVCPVVVPPRCAATEADPVAARQAHEQAGAAAADVSRDVAVAAGAGTGKTYNLVLRYLAALADGATPNEILCITFTRHAAAEMKKRVREALLSAPSGPQRPYVERLRHDKQAFRRLLLQLSAAPITTIDAFAGNVFREVQALRASRSGISAPNLQVVTDGDVSEQLRTYVRQRFMASLEADDPHLRHLAEQLDPLSVRDLLLEASKRDISEELANLDTLAARTDYLLDGWYRIMRPAAQDLFARLQEWPLGELVALLNAAKASTKASGRPTDEGAAWLEHFTDVVQQGGTGADHTDWEMLQQAFYRRTPASDFGDKEIGKSIRDLRRDLWAVMETTDTERVAACKSFMGSVESLPEYAATAAHATFVAQRWAEGFRAHLVETGRVRFSDVEHLASRALQDPTITADIGSRFAYRHIFVDECQDTSYSQIRLVDAARAVAEKATGRPCQQFFVGDVKQSIYGFRGAEVDVFTKRVAAGAETFTVNRRSTPGLIRAFNRLFEPLFGAAAFAELLDPRTVMPYAPLVWPDELRHDDSEPAIELFCAAGDTWFESDDADESEDEESAEEPEEIFKSTALQRSLAKRVGELVQQYPPGDDGPSIALLVGSWARADFYRDLLNAYEVPAAVQGGRGLLNTPEVDGLLQWMEAVAYRNQRTSMLSVLRGPGIAMSDAGLYCLREGYGVSGLDREPPYYLSSAAQAVLDPEAAVRSWMEYDPSLDADRAFYLLSRDAVSLQRFQDIWSMLPSRLGVEAPSETLAWLADELGLWTFWHAREGGRQAVANLRTTLDLVRDLESTLGQDPWVLLRRLSEMRGNSDPAAGGLDASGGAPVVITTYWQAKGLEWPVVVLPDVEKTRVRMSPRGLGDNRICIVDADFDVVHTPEIRTSSPENPLRTKVTAVSDVLDQYRRPAKRAELRRLLYVAMTRAKSKLVISGTFEVPRKKPDDEKPTYLHDAKDWATTLRVCLGLHVPAGDFTLHGADDSPWASLQAEGIVKLVDGIEYGLGATQRAPARALVQPPQTAKVARRWLTIPSSDVKVVRPSDLDAPEVPAPASELTTALPERQQRRTTVFESDADLGTAFHQVMEDTAFALGPDEIEPAVRQALSALRFDLPRELVETRVTEVTEMVTVALGCTICEELRDAAIRGELYHELPITYLRSDSERIFGVIDLCWRDQDGRLHVLDYKTGFRVPTLAEPETEQLRHHHAQVAEYRSGLERCGYPVASYGVWYVAAPYVVRWTSGM